MAGLPVVIGMVLMTLPSRLTVIFLVLASTVETWLRPMVKRHGLGLLAVDAGAALDAVEVEVDA